MISTYAETEDDLQKRVVEWLNVALPPGCVFHHSPNEGRRHVAFKRKLRRWAHSMAGLTWRYLCQATRLCMASARQFL